jgi:dTDP-4-dehydro-6-deoxy-alpha-D-gulose 4-ketoreductase
MNSFWKGKRVLLTGASGFIGSWISEYLLQYDAIVTGVYFSSKPITNYKINFLPKKINLLDSESLIKASKQHDIIINSAALDGNSLFKNNNAARILDENIKITSNILNSAKINHIKTVVLISSADIYPKSSISPIKESDDYTNNFDNIYNGYVLSKRYAELLGNLYFKNYGINVFLPRPTNVYGPNDNFNNESRVIPSMISKILKNEKVDIWGTGKQERGFIYVEDAARAILDMVENGKERILNITGEEYISIENLANKIGKLSDKNVRFNFINNNSVMEISRFLDPTILKSVISFKPLSLEKGLKKTIKWYLDKQS